MKPYLRILPHNFAAGSDHVTLPYHGNFLRVLRADQTFTFTLGDDTEVPLRPGMGVYLGDDQAFKKLRIKRDDATEATTLEIACGWQPADSPLVLTDNRAVADIHTTTHATVNVQALNALPVPPTRGRFVPRYSASTTLAGDPVFNTALGAPLVRGDSPPAVNLLAPRSADVIRRRVRLLSGDGASIGVSVGDLAHVGRSFAVSTAHPEIVIDGGEPLFGISDADAELSIYEVMQSARPVPDFTQVHALEVVTLSDLALFPPPSLSGSVSYSFAIGSAVSTAWGSGTLSNTGLTTSPAWSAASTGSVTKTAGADVNAVNTIAFSSMLPASVNPYAQSSAGILVRDDCAYVLFSLAGANTSSRINTSTGQTFALPLGAGTMGADREFRVAFPLSGAAPYFEQKTKAGTAWVRGS